MAREVRIGGRTMYLPDRDPEPAPASSTDLVCSGCGAVLETVALGQDAHWKAAPGGWELCGRLVARGDAGEGG